MSSIIHFTETEYNRAYENAKLMWPKYEGSEGRLRYAAFGLLSEIAVFRYAVSTGMGTTHGNDEETYLQKVVFRKEKFSDDGGVDLTTFSPRENWQIKWCDYHCSQLRLKRWQYTDDLRYERTNVYIDKFALVKLVNPKAYDLELAGYITADEFMKKQKTVFYGNIEFWCVDKSELRPF